MAKSRRGEKPLFNGWLCLHKPRGITSNHCLNQLRRLLNQRKMGHTGTLDPDAEGVLMVALGDATKTIPYCTNTNKSYHGTVEFGYQSTTDDSTGEAIATSEHRPTLGQLIDAMPQFLGQIRQIPPQVSAVHIDGKRAYERARNGETFTIAPRDTEVFALELLEVTTLAGDTLLFPSTAPLGTSTIRDFGLAHNETGADTGAEAEAGAEAAHCPDTTIASARFAIDARAGFYMRSFARDLAQAVGTYAVLRDLIRVRVGTFDSNHLCMLDTIAEKVHNGAALEEHLPLLPLDAPLDGIPAWQANKGEVTKLWQGMPVRLNDRQAISDLHSMSPLANNSNDAINQLPPNDEGGDSLLVRITTPNARMVPTFVGLCRLEGGCLLPERMFNVAL
ncbi:MAG: tRNA pseudouridine(55) synthase TruB [Alphaproteobacteria bacterium]|nr:tRNA pseudouridine(55) synthase TruB [Alphaproteobacteria bacterium]